MADPIVDLEAGITSLEERGQALIDYIVAFDARIAAKDTQIADLITASNLSAADKAALLAKITALTARTTALENKERNALPAVPPVGGTPLALSYADKAAFDAAVAAYTGTEQVTLDGVEVRAATVATATPSAYFTQADGSISTTATTGGTTGGTTMAASYASKADFDAAAAADTSGNQIQLDGVEVRAPTTGSTPMLYFTHSADGSISTTGPTN
jgi:hypothetical protein